MLIQLPAQGGGVFKGMPLIEQSIDLFFRISSALLKLSRMIEQRFKFHLALGGKGNESVLFIQKIFQRGHGISL